MPDASIPCSPSLFSTTLNECRELYVSSGRLCVHEYPDRIKPAGEKFVELMDDLHRAVVLKTYVSVCEADRGWSSEERFLAETLFEHLWGKRLTGDDLRTAARRAAEDSAKLKWYSLVRPFDQIVPLRDRVGALETVVVRLANIIARADGDLNEREAAVIKSIQEELRAHLRPVPIDEPTDHEGTDAETQQAIDSIAGDAADIYAATRPSAKKPKGGRSMRTKAASKLTPAKPDLKELLAELDALVGLDDVKQEVRTLTNLLKMQKLRDQAGLPDVEMSLHMVFTGNPGTGKTTVARILGKIFGAMGVLSKGHLVETDRSGLVAEFMGQTGPKTQAKINEALDGVLFIDEAYSLMAKDGQDQYGTEALQALLKRAEDDRKRLVVILAGYPDEMETMLKSNPGLSSRFNRVLHFEDYSPVELAKIFGFLCEKNRYELLPAARAKLLVSLAALHKGRDRHFGNGRASRNLFELAIRRMANRIAEIPHLTADALTRLEVGDIRIEGIADGCEIDSRDYGPWRFRVQCPKCSQISKARGSLLGQMVRCKKCSEDFVAEWGEPVETPVKTN